jgi:RimJ/RimL family protein N-acetyltransferase
MLARHLHAAGIIRRERLRQELLYCCARDNGKNCTILQRLGFQEEGALRQAEWLIDHFEDQIVYGILAEEWRQAHGATTS